MSIAEGANARVAYKAYASGTISSNSQPTSSSALGATSAQVLRRVSSSLKLNKDTYQSNEVRADRQVVDFRHGIERVGGSISGELSPATYFAFIEAAMLGTKSAAAVAKSNSELTSVAADNSDSRFTFGGGDPVSEGYRVGDIIRFTNLSETANNSTNYLILAFGGASNREVTVYPAPTDMGADSAFNVTTVGKSVYVPESGFVSRKFGLEHYFADVDVAKLFTECRVGGFTIQLPASGLATIEVPFAGRDMELLTGSDAPFFTSPTAAGTDGILAAVNGALYVAGTRVGVITGLNISLDLAPSTDAVVGQNFVPEVHLGTFNVTGQLQALFESETLFNYFRNETEVAILAYLTETSDIASPAISIYLPRVKFSDADVPLQGATSQPISLPFQALKKESAGSGDLATPIRIVDTQAS